MVQKEFGQDARKKMITGLKNVVNKEGVQRFQLSKTINRKEKVVRWEMCGDL